MNREIKFTCSLMPDMCLPWVRMECRRNDEYGFDGETNYFRAMEDKEWHPIFGKSSHDRFVNIDPSSSRVAATASLVAIFTISVAAVYLNSMDVSPCKVLC